MSSTTLPKTSVPHAAAAPTAPAAPTADQATAAARPNKRRRDDAASSHAEAKAPGGEPVEKRSRPTLRTVVDAAATDRPLRPLPRAAASSNLAGLQSPAGQTPAPVTTKATSHGGEASEAGEAKGAAAAERLASSTATKTSTPGATPKAEKNVQQERLEDAYRLNLQKLHQQTKWARKAMPMVMQSAGMGLALAGAIHNPLLLFVAPLLMVSGAIMAAPAGWALGKFFQYRVTHKNQLVAHTLRQLDDELAHQPGAAEAKAKIYAAYPKLQQAEELARGRGKPFETGFKSAYVGPYRFWRNQFNDTLAMVSSVAAARKNKGEAKLDAKPEA